MAHSAADKRRICLGMNSKLELKIEKRHERREREELGEIFERMHQDEEVESKIKFTDWFSSEVPIEVLDRETW